MIAVIFEVQVANGGREAYLAHAAALAEELRRMEGFLSVERFQSLAEPGKLLSLSFWRDEEAVARWRNHEGHRAAQAAGRGGVFSDYRLRIAAVVRDYGMAERREQAPEDSNRALVRAPVRRRAEEAVHESDLVHHPQPEDRG